MKPKNCRSHICTCGNPNHRCAHNHRQPHFNGKTMYDYEFTPKKTKPTTVYKARDNLKNQPGIKGNTVYNTDYIKQITQSGLLRNYKEQRDMKKVIKKNRDEDRNVVNTKNLFYNDFGKEEKESRYVYQPATRENPWQRRRDDAKSVDMDTTYRNHYKGANKDLNRHVKINYDNLKVGNGGGFKAKTTYSSQYGLKNGVNKGDKDLYRYGQERNRGNTDIFVGNRDLKTVYNAEYTKKERDIVFCELERLPRVPKELLWRHKHVVFDYDEGVWKALD